MDCRSFRKHHLAYLDNTLPGELLVAAECHVIECEVCARHDTAVRRSLLLARNLAPIEPSADFEARLEARLRAELAASAAAGGRGRRGMDPAGLDRAALIHRAFGTRTRAAAAAAALLMLTAGAGATLEWTGEPAAALRHPPVVASLPEPEPAPPAFVASDLVTSASTGVSVWPAALLADQIPVQLLGGGQFQMVSYGY